MQRFSASLYTRVMVVFGPPYMRLKCVCCAPFVQHITVRTCRTFCSKEFSTSHKTGSASIPSCSAKSRSVLQSVFWQQIINCHCGSDLWTLLRLTLFSCRFISCINFKPKSKWFI